MDLLPTAIARIVINDDNNTIPIAKPVLPVDTLYIGTVTKCERGTHWVDINGEIYWIFSENIVWPNLKVHVHNNIPKEKLQCYASNQGPNALRPIINRGYYELKPNTIVVIYGHIGPGIHPFFRNQQERVFNHGSFHFDDNIMKVVHTTTFPYFGILRNPKEWLHKANDTQILSCVNSLNSGEVPVRFKLGTEPVNDFDLVVEIPRGQSINIKKIVYEKNLEDQLDNHTCLSAFNYIESQMLKHVPMEINKFVQVIDVRSFYDSHLYYCKDRNGKVYNVDSRYIKAPNMWNNGNGIPINTMICSNGEPNLSTDGLNYSVAEGTYITLVDGWNVGNSFKGNCHVTDTRPLLKEGHVWQPYIKYFGESGWPKENDTFIHNGKKQVLASYFFAMAIAITKARLWENFENFDWNYTINCTDPFPCPQTINCIINPLLNRALEYNDHSGASWTMMLSAMTSYINCKKSN